MERACGAAGPVCACFNYSTNVNDPKDLLVAEACRLDELRGQAVLDTPAEPAFDRLTKLATRFLSAPVALVSFVDRDRQWFKSALGLPEPYASLRETPLSHSFCKTVVATRTALVIEDARLDSRVAGNLAIRDLGVIAYLGVPLVSESGYVLGSFCVIDGSPRRWTEEQVATMKDLAAVVTTELRLRKLLAEHEVEQVELRKAKASAEDAVRIRGAFLSHFSHELRTPLNAVLGFGEILESELAEEGQTARAEYAHSIVSSGQHLLNLIDGILDFSRAESGMAELVLAQVDVVSVCREVAGLVQPLVSKNGNSIEVTLPSSAVGLEVDATRLRQILLNLLGNAAKFTRNGRIQLILERVGSGDGARLEFRVEDTGIGMTPEQLGRLFQPFVQATAGTSGQYGGSGLGLAISRRYAQMMGGDIEVRSEVGRGSVFTLWLRV
jgi:hypothetical protein